MTEDIERQEALFDGARGIANTEQRDAFLQEGCGGDADLLRTIEKLLNASDRAEQFFADCTPTESTISAALEADILDVEKTGFRQENRL